MKKRGTILLFILLAVVALFASLPAQPKEQKPQMYFIYEQAVRPDGDSRFYDAIKEEWARATEFKIPFYPVSAWVTEDFHYYFLVPIKNMADVDAMETAWGKFHEELKAKMGDQAYQELLKKLEDTVDYRQFHIYTYWPNLSYIPQNPRLKPGEGKFANWTFNYIKDGKEQEFENLLGEFVALFKSKDIPELYEIASGSFGAQMPVYVIWAWAKDGADYFSSYESAKGLLGKDGLEKLHELWGRFYALTKKVESKNAYYLPDLSYTPPPPPPPPPATKKKK